MKRFLVTILLVIMMSGCSSGQKTDSEDVWKDAYSKGFLDGVASVTPTPTPFPTPTPDPTIVPISTFAPSSEITKYYMAAPKMIFLTFASENKLNDRLMYCDGVVAGFATEVGYETMSMTTDDGQIRFIDMDIRAERFNDIQIGDRVRAFFLYIGWSEVFNCASGAIVDVSSISAPITDMTGNMKLAISLFWDDSYPVSDDVLTAYMNRAG